VLSVVLIDDLLSAERELYVDTPFRPTPDPIPDAQRQQVQDEEKKKNLTLASQTRDFRSTPRLKPMVRPRTCTSPASFFKDSTKTQMCAVV
jgi:hypothetical protein